MWLIDSGPVLTCGRTSEPSGTRPPCWLRTQSRLKLSNLRALAIEQFEDDPIDVEGSLDLTGHALREGDGQRVLDILAVHAVAVGLVTQDL